MKPSYKSILSFVTLMAGLSLAGQAAASKTSSPVIPIWPAGTAQVDPNILEEVVPRDFELVKNIHNPNLTVFRPDNPNGAAVVICPGGGYGVIAPGLEGYPIAEKLNEAGITAFVLKYRLPTTEGAEFKHPVPLSDALRAIQWVRYHSSEYKLDPKRIGIMGFSAGGHLAASAGTLYAKYSFGSDGIAQISSRPDFMCLGYPVISTQKGIAHGCVRHPLTAGFSSEQLAEMSCELNVTAQTPPTFLLHAKDDKGVLPQNSMVMHEALKQQGVLTELKLYEQGGHGFGLGRKGTDSAQWMGDFIAWLSSMQIIGSTGEFYTPTQDLNALNTEAPKQAGLPNVLIIGDSISIGYTQPVIEQLKSVANVQRVKSNGGDTQRGLQSLHAWLGDTQWDVIHFNWGLHDLCYRHPQSKVYGKRDKVKGTIAVPLEQYGKNLEALVLQLQQTDATLIWASTTLVPQGEAGRRVGDEVKYNAVAKAIMLKHGVAINDLHALTASFPPQLFSRPGDVHYKKEGSAQLAQQVASVIQRALPEQSVVVTYSRKR
jgi:acetyl esterase/lipase